MLTSGTGEFQGISGGMVGIFTAYKRAIDSSFLPHAFFQPQPTNLPSSSAQKKSFVFPTTPTSSNHDRIRLQGQVGSLEHGVPGHKHCALAPRRGPNHPHSGGRRKGRFPPPISLEG